MKGDEIIIYWPLMADEFEVLQEIAQTTITECFFFSSVQGGVVVLGVVLEYQEKSASRQKIKNKNNNKSKYEQAQTNERKNIWLDRWMSELGWMDGWWKGGKEGKSNNSRKMGEKNPELKYFPFISSRHNSY